jgi:hypothetical protein
MRRAERMAREGERRGVYRDWMGKPEERRKLLTYRSRWRMILVWILKKKDGRSWTGFVRIRI